MLIPSTLAHHEITKRLLGDPHANVHRLIDSTVSIPRKKLIELGLSDLVDSSSHRSDWIHSKEFWLYLYAFGKITFEELLVAFMHFESDKLDTKTKHGLDDVFNSRWRINRLKAKILKGKEYSK